MTHLRKYMSSFLMISFWIIALSCSTYNGNGETSKKDTGMLQRIYVEKIEPAESTATTEKLKVRISGNFPSPAYTFERFDVDIKGNIIEITPLAVFDSTKMVAQVLVPFDEVCNVENLKPGAYEIKVYGRGESAVKTGTIQVKK